MRPKITFDGQAFIIHSPRDHPLTIKTRGQSHHPFKGGREPFGKPGVCLHLARRARTGVSGVVGVSANGAENKGIIVCW